MKSMKLLVFNASPRKSSGTTDVLLETFIEGARSSGADVEKHHIVDLEINGCRGCFNCWWVTPGKCIQRDDMDKLLPAISEADLMLLGTPIYGRNVTHYLQKLLERTFVFTLPEMVNRDGETQHPGRVSRFPRMILAATCGFPDTSNFDIVRALYPMALPIFLPAAQLLLYEEGKKQLSGFLQAVRLAGQKITAGEELTRKMKDELIVEYSDEMKKAIVEMHNRYSESLSQ
ncbi:MAG: Iron-sulfur flavoprotein [Candidatus Thorarchaeota archaeon AB_25]|nr:MAG: Iron-sulfur flavoprotein [Candidatus Thorarchaeota archaeon AB_25]